MAEQKIYTESANFGLVSNGTMDRKKKTPTNAGAFSIANNLYFLAKQLPELNKQSKRRPNKDGSIYMYLGNLKVDPKISPNEGLKSRMRFYNFMVYPDTKNIWINATITQVVRNQIVKKYKEVINDLKKKTNNSFTPESLKQALLNTPVLITGIYDNSMDNLQPFYMYQTVRKPKKDDDGNVVTDKNGQPVMDIQRKDKDVPQTMSLLLRWVEISFNSPVPKFMPFVPQYDHVTYAMAHVGKDEKGDQLALKDIVPTDLEAAYRYQLNVLKGQYQRFQQRGLKQDAEATQEQIKQINAELQKLVADRVAKNTENSDTKSDEKKSDKEERTFKHLRLTDNGDSDGAIFAMNTLGFFKNFNSHKSGVKNLMRIKNDDGTSFVTCTLAELDWNKMSDFDKLIFPDSVIEEFNRNKVHRVIFKRTFSSFDFDEHGLPRKGSFLDHVQNYDFGKEYPNQLWGFVGSLKLSKDASSHFNYYVDGNGDVNVTLLVARPTFFYMHTVPENFKSSTFTGSGNYDEQADFDSLAKQADNARESSYSEDSSDPFANRPLF